MFNQYSNGKYTFRPTGALGTTLIYFLPIFRPAGALGTTLIYFLPIFRPAGALGTRLIYFLPSVGRQHFAPLGLWEQY